MTWSHVMFALASPGDIAPIELNKVAELTAGLDAELELFHCIYDADVARPGRFATRGAQEDIRGFVEFRRNQLEVAAGPFRARGLRVRTNVRWDYPAYEGIVRQVLRHRPDLLIARTTSEAVGGRRPFTRADFKLIEDCPCPVLFIQTRNSYADAVMAAAVDPALRHGKPAALDLEILESASRIRDALSARLLLFHARTPHEHPARTEATAPAEPDSQLLSLADQYNVPRERVHILDGYPAEALPAFAQKQMVDILVLGAATRSPLRRAVIGHTAERVLDALVCDVLIVKAPGFLSAITRQSKHHVPKSSAIASRDIR